MQTSDIESLFARAEQAFVGGRFDAARADLAQVQQLTGEHPAVLHLRALVEKKSGNIEAARAAFVRAIALAPNDAQLAGNYANLLNELGNHEEALALYDRAIAANPRFADARYNRALLLQKLGRLDEALADLDTTLAAAPADPKLNSARGTLLRQLGRIDEAADAFDAALRHDPSRVTALHGRARVAMERGEVGAASYFSRALKQRSGDLDLLLGRAEALEAEGDPAGLHSLTEAVAANPDWLIGHEALARMRSEAGDAEGFADHYLHSIKLRPSDQALHYSYWRSLAKGERHAEALAALHAARGSIVEAPILRLMEAIFTSEAGDPHEALRLLDGLDAAWDGGMRFAHGRIALRAGDAEQAAASFEAMVSAEPDAVNGWAHLDLAWRLLGDVRHDWLTGQPGLVGSRDIGFNATELEQLAGLLRTLHITRAHPIGQSLRGGTQTRGRLFARREPEIIRLRDAIMAAVGDHFTGLPPRDPLHPLLKHRDSPFAIEGCWSVRLVGRGFHVNHIHPEGSLSSACYISLPETLGTSDTRDGWLELGRPPKELGLKLDPIAMIEPRPGRLALFPSYLFHGTRPFSEGERLTVAFDVVAR